MEESTIEQDMQARLRPTPEQVAVAQAMLGAAPGATHVMVALAMPGKTRGLWFEGQDVQPVEGFWLTNRDHHDGPLSYHYTRRLAGSAALAWLLAADQSGTCAYVAIDRAGDWVVFER